VLLAGYTAMTAVCWDMKNNTKLLSNSKLDYIFTVFTVAVVQIVVLQVVTGCNLTGVYCVPAVVNL